MSFEGYHQIENAVDSGIGPILALPHLGGWEWGGFWLAATWKHKVTVVVEPLEPPELFEWFAALRRVASAWRWSRSAPAPARRSARPIKEANVICLLCDRDIGGRRRRGRVLR